MAEWIMSDGGAILLRDGESGKFSLSLKSLIDWGLLKGARARARATTYGAR